MTRIKRGGRELVVDDSFVAEYLKQGYSVINDKGEEITRAKALTYDQAMRELNAATERNKRLTEALRSSGETAAALKAEIKKLKAENAELKKNKEPEKTSNQENK